MIPGKISDTDIGRSFLTTDGEEVTLLGLVCGLMRCQTGKGIVLYTAFDIAKPISAKIKKEVISKPKPVSSKVIRKIGRPKQIVAIDCEGNQHAFQSLTEAAIAFKTTVSCIGKAAKNNRPLRGIIWEYV